LLAAVYGKEGLPRDLASICDLDPTSASKLQPWFGFTAADTISDSIYDPVRQLLTVYLDIHDVSSLTQYTRQRFTFPLSSMPFANHDPLRSMMLLQKDLSQLCSLVIMILGTIPSWLHLSKALTSIWATKHCSRYFVTSYILSAMFYTTFEDISCSAGSKIFSKAHGNDK
jgi:hypothetical protein